MAKAIFPTSKDIHLEIDDGRKIAVVQSYKAFSQCDSRPVEAFGEAEPVGNSRGTKSYTITLSRLYLTDVAIKDGIDFHDLIDFKLVIVKPDQKITYTNCNWIRIGEEANLNETVAENVEISATGRMVIKV